MRRVALISVAAVVESTTIGAAFLGRAWDWGMGPARGHRVAVESGTCSGASSSAADRDAARLTWRDALGAMPADGSPNCRPSTSDRSPNAARLGPRMIDRIGDTPSKREGCREYELEKDNPSWTSNPLSPQPRGAASLVLLAWSASSALPLPPSVVNPPRPPPIARPTRTAPS